MKDKLVFEEIIPFRNRKELYQNTSNKTLRTQKEVIRKIITREV